MQSARRYSIATASMSSQPNSRNSIVRQPIVADDLFNRLQTRAVSGEMTMPFGTGARDMSSTAIGSNALFTHTAPRLRTPRGTTVELSRRRGQLRRLPDELSVPRVQDSTRNLCLR